MAYTPQAWFNEPSTASPVNATRLNHIEDGVLDASNRLDTVEAAQYTDEKAQDAAAAMVAAGTHSGVSFAYNDTSNSLSATVPASYTDEQAQDAAAALIAAGTHSGITFTYNDASNALSAAVASQGGIPASTIDAKGDLLAGTANDTVARLGVGTNGQVLTADSTQTAGVRWTTVASSTDARMPGLAVYAKDFGAVGDDTTNDTTALQNALNAINTGDAFPASGGVLHLERHKNYLITSALTIPAYGLTIEMNGATIHQNTANANCVQGVDVTALTIRNGMLRGPSGGSPTGTGKGISLTRSAADLTFRVTLENLLVDSFGSDGINLSNPIEANFAGVECRSNGGHGFNIHGVNGGAAGTSCSFNACYANGNLQAGYHLDTMTYSAFTACAADTNGIAYDLVACQGIAFVGCGCEGPVNNGTSYPGTTWKISGCRGVSIVGGWIYNSVGIACLVTGSSTGVQVIGLTEVQDGSPAGTTGIKVDAGSTATIIDSQMIAANTLTAGCVTINNGVIKPLTTTTANRPTAASATQGGMVYDTTLSKPIWSTGSAWRDAAGTTV